MESLRKLSAIDPQSGNANVIIETPKGCRNKYAFDFETGACRLKKVLPRGAVFPYDFGSIPRTIAPDGDPLDVLLLMDEPAFPGCVVEARLIGVIEATQSKNGTQERNDRLIAVAAKSQTHDAIKSLKKIDPKIIEEIEHFFVSYNAGLGKKFKVISRKGPTAAINLVTRHSGRKNKKLNGKTR
jgi:inorganic pyrophosphatase